MTKKHFITLENTIRSNPTAFSADAVSKLADFCAQQNPLFKLADFCAQQNPLFKLADFCAQQNPLFKLADFCAQQVTFNLSTKSCHETRQPHPLHRATRRDERH